MGKYIDTQLSRVIKTKHQESESSHISTESLQTIYKDNSDYTLRNTKRISLYNSSTVPFPPARATIRLALKTHLFFTKVGISPSYSRID